MYVHRMTIKKYKTETTSIVRKVLAWAMKCAKPTIIRNKIRPIHKILFNRKLYDLELANLNISFISIAPKRLETAGEGTG